MKKLFQFLFVCALAVHANAEEEAKVTDGRLQLSVHRSPPWIPGTFTRTDEPKTEQPKAKRYETVHLVEVKNIGSEELVIPVYQKIDPSPPRMHSLKEDEFWFEFDLARSADGSVLIAPFTSVTLRQGETATLSYFGAALDAGESLPRYTVVYRVSKEYGARHHCWSGTLKVVLDPIVLTPKEPNQALQPTPAAGRG